MYNPYLVKLQQLRHESNSDAISDDKYRKEEKVIFNNWRKDLGLEQNGQAPPSAYWNWDY